MTINASQGGGGEKGRESTAVELSGIDASGLLPPHARENSPHEPIQSASRFMGARHLQKEKAAFHEPSMFSPQIQSYRRFGFPPIGGSPESAGKTLRSWSQWAPIVAWRLRMNRLEIEQCQMA